MSWLSSPRAAVEEETKRSSAPRDRSPILPRNNLIAKGGDESWVARVGKDGWGSQEAQESPRQRWLSPFLDGPLLSSSSRGPCLGLAPGTGCCASRNQRGSNPQKSCQRCLKYLYSSHAGLIQHHRAFPASQEQLVT